MNNLEKKIYKYFKKHYVTCIMTKEFAKELAKDLAEIAEKHYDLYDDLVADKDYAIKELEEENATLKQQLKGIRYFSRDEVEKILEEYRKWIIKDKSGFLHNEIPFWDRQEKNKAITAICNLAIPSKDKIIKVLKKWILNVVEFDYRLLFTEYQKITDTPNEIFNKTLEQIANEILNDKPIDCYDKEGNIIKGGDRR